MEHRNVTLARAEPVKMAFDVEDAAWRLSVSPSFIRLEIKRGRLAASRVGRRLLIAAADLERYLNENALGGSRGTKEMEDGKKEAG